MSTQRGERCRWALNKHQEWLTDCKTVVKKWGSGDFNYCPSCGKRIVRMTEPWGTHIVKGGAE